MDKWVVREKAVEPVRARKSIGAVSLHQSTITQCRRVLRKSEIDHLRSVLMEVSSSMEDLREVLKRLDGLYSCY